MGLSSVLLDTGSARTLFAVETLAALGLTIEPTDSIRIVQGIGGREYVFTKRIDRVALGDLVVTDFAIQAGALDYGRDIEGIIGLDFLLRTRAVIDLGRSELLADSASHS